jgi:hypothetical protein
MNYDGHNRERLDKLSLACKELKRIAPKGLPFLDLPAIEAESWRHLKQFGVRVSDHYHFVCHCIRTLMTKQTTKKDVTHLYLLSQKCFARDGDEISMYHLL